MAKPRNFDAEYNKEKVPGLEFILGGKTLRTKPLLHPAVFLTDLDSVASSVKLFKALLVDEDQATFQEMLDNPGSNISISQISEVISWVISEVTAPDRPTKPSSSSGNGRGRTATTSKVTSLPKAETGNS